MRKRYLTIISKTPPTDPSPTDPSAGSCRLEWLSNYTHNQSDLIPWEVITVTYQDPGPLEYVPPAPPTSDDRIRFHSWTFLHDGSGRGPVSTTGVTIGGNSKFYAYWVRV